MLFFFIFLIVATNPANARPNSQNGLIFVQDSLVPQDSLIVNDSPPVSSDSTEIQQDTTESNQESSLKTTVTYAARDSIKVDAVKNLAYLYGDAKVTYGKIELTADYMEIDMTKEEVKATYSVDSLGEPIGKPVYNDGSDMFVADLIRYNFTTKKGIVSGVVTQQGEGYVHGDRVKFNEKMESFINDAKYTTCNLPNPHFHIKAKKIKMIPEKKVIAGPFYMQVNDVPTPLGFPFGMFPIPKEKSSGIIIPKYGESQDRGFFLRDGGYYWAVNDYMAMKFLGEIYSNGSWGVQYNNQYKKKYAYGGNFNVKYNNRIQGTGGEREEFRDYWVKWRHTPVAKGPYGSRLTAEVSLGSQNFNQRNSFNIDDFQSAQFNSNVTWSKSYRNTPFNSTVTLRQSQNTATGIMDLTLPNINLSSNRIYPFKKVNSLRKSDFFKKFAVGPRLDFQNNMNNRPRNTTEINGVEVKNGASEADSMVNTEPSIERLLLSSSSGAQFTAPISTSMKIFKYFNLNPSITITDYWYFEELDIQTSPDGEGVVIDTIEGFSRAGEWSARAALTTRVYGTFFFPKSKNVKAIRHTFIPTISANWRPDFSETGNAYTEVVINDSTGETQKFMKYNGFVYGGPSASEQRTLNFTMANVLEMKKVDKRDSTGGTKKVKLFDNLGLTGNYNFAAEEFNLSKINLNFVSKIGLFNFNIPLTFDPYAYRLDSVVGEQVYQERINEFNWNVSNQALRLDRAAVNVSASFNPKTFKGQNYESKEGTEEELAYINDNPEMYVDFSIPWSLRLSYNFAWLKEGFEQSEVTQNLSFQGDLRVTEKWKIGFRSAIDLVEGELSTTSITINRDLHCWQMSLSWIPNGIRQSFTFDINVKASILQDLKLNKRNSWYDN